MSGRALTDSGGSTQVWYRKAGEVRQLRLLVCQVEVTARLHIGLEVPWRPHQLCLQPASPK